MAENRVAGWTPTRRTPSIKSSRVTRITAACASQGLFSACWHPPGASWLMDTGYRFALGRERWGACLNEEDGLGHLVDHCFHDPFMVRQAHHERGEARGARDEGVDVGLDSSASLGMTGSGDAWSVCVWSQCQKERVDEREAGTELPIDQRLLASGIPLSREHASRE